MNSNPEEKVRNFYKMWRDKNGISKDITAHNVYYIESVDMDGNTTGEGYAINVMTNPMFDQALGTSAPIRDTFRGIYIGNGASGDPGVNDYKMFSPFGGFGTENAAIRVTRDATRDTDHVMEWDSETQLLSCVIFHIQGYFDYTKFNRGDEQPREITEIGVSCDAPMYNGGSFGGVQDAEHLALHAAVYDGEGNLGGVYKRYNERLYISVYAAIAMKPQKIEAQLEADDPNARFAMDPYILNLHCGGFDTSGDVPGLRYYVMSYICSPRCTNKTDDTSYTGEQWCTFGASFSKGSYSGAMRIDYHEYIPDVLGSYKHVMTANTQSQLIETHDNYVDTYLFQGGGNRVDRNYSARYSNHLNVVTPIKLDRDEDFIDVTIYVDDLNNDTIIRNYGIPFVDNTRIDGNLPIVDFKASSIKVYNGLTKDWDITETVVHGMDNSYLLSRYYIYPWTMVRMRTPYSTNTGVVIWFNHWTDKPIKSIDRDIDMYASDAWWDPSTWVHIDDYTDISDAIGSKKFFMTFGGSRWTTSSPWNHPYYNFHAGTIGPIVVTRGNVTKPAITLAANSQLTNMDQFNYQVPHDVTFVNPIAAGVPYRQHIPCESRGYIWMSNSIYYPAEDVSYPIETSDCISNINQPIPSIRFTEPSGKRILQIFRADTVQHVSYDTSFRYIQPRMSKISVFDIPDHTNHAAPTEYLLTMPADYLDIWKEFGTGSEITAPVDLTSTETGYVVFAHRTANRVDIVNLLGDANSNYEPYVYQLLHPATNEPLSTKQCFAIKYTNYVVVHDTTYNSDTVWKYLIIDLTDNSIYQEFEIPKESATEVRYIRGWKNFLYIVLWNDTTSMPLMIYDMTEEPANRLANLPDNLSFAQALIPGGAYYAISWGKATAWYRMMGAYTFGDEHCFLVYRNANGNAVGDNKGAMPIYYIDDDDPYTPVNINSVYDYNRTAYWYYKSNNGQQTEYLLAGVEMNVSTFNQGKQRMLIVNFNGSDYTSLAFTAYYDLNVIRDTRTAPPKKNDFNYKTSYFPYNTTYDANNCGKYCSIMYDEKVWIFEYDTSGANYGNKANILKVDPNRVLPHYMTGTTRTIQCYNDPKRIYGINKLNLEFINDESIWGTDDL